MNRVDWEAFARAELGKDVNLAGLEGNARLAERAAIGEIESALG